MIKGIVPLAAWPPEQSTNKRRTCSSLYPLPNPPLLEQLTPLQAFSSPARRFNFPQAAYAPLMRYLPSYTFRHCINNTPLLTPMYPL